jgi:hypothetical protein
MVVEVKKTTMLTYVMKWSPSVSIISHDAYAGECGFANLSKLSYDIASAPSVRSNWQISAMPQFAATLNFKLTKGYN